MNIVVCIKQILDPEVAPKDFSIDKAAHRPVAGNAKMVMDSFAENSLEVALQLKEKNGGSITALCVGDKPMEEVLRRALGLKADKAVRVWDPGWEELDAGAVAHILGKAIEKLGGADLVFLGRQAGDVERGLVGPMLAEELNIACTTLAYNCEESGGTLRLKCETEGGYVVVESQLPAVVTVTSNETNVPRLAKVKDLMMASRQPIEVFNGADLSLDSTRVSPSVNLQELFIPVLNSTCELIEGEGGPEMAVNLTKKLLELKAL